MDSTTTKNSVNTNSSPTAASATRSKQGEFLVPLRGELRFATDGSWWHDGTLVEHTGVAQFFSTHAHWSEQHQCFVVSNGPTCVPYSFDDTPFLVTELTMSELPWSIRLSNNHQETFQVGTVSLAPDGSWHLLAFAGTVRVRLSRTVAQSLWPLVEQTASGVYGLRVYGEIVPLAEFKS